MEGDKGSNEVLRDTISLPDCQPLLSLAYSYTNLFI